MRIIKYLFLCLLLFAVFNSDLTSLLPNIINSPFEHLVNPRMTETFVTAFITKAKIFLLSDGRAINTKDGTVHDKWSKVHKLTNHVGMLTAGAYLPNIKVDIIRKCKMRNLIYVNGVTEIASLVLEETWKRSCKPPTIKMLLKT